MLPAGLAVPRFVTTGEVFCGPGAIGVLRVLDAARVAVLVSGSVLDGPLDADTIDDTVGGMKRLVLRMPRGEPSLPAIRSVAAELAAFGPDYIVAIGGGSVIDAAKVAWVLMEHPDLDEERLIRFPSVPHMRGRARFAAVPTTAGTGAEVSSASLFVAGTGHGKSLLVSHELLADVVVLDPRLTLGVPRAAAAAAGLDALAHAIESYVSRNENALADILAEQAARTLLDELESDAGACDDLHRRLRVMIAAMIAGWVQNMKVPGIAHAVAHQLARFGIAHGRAVGALLGPAIRFNACEAAVRTRYDRLAAALGLGSTDGLAARVEALAHALDVALPRLSIPCDDLNRLATSAVDDPCARANPRPLDAATIEAFIHDVDGLA